MSHVFLFTLFSLPLIFTLHWWRLAFLILLPPLQNYHVVLPTKKCLICFLSLTLDLCRRFSRWASLACRLLSLFLGLSLTPYSKSVDMTINVSLVCLWCGRTFGRAGGRSVYGHVITKFSRMASLPHFPTHGAPMCALRARELRYYFPFENFRHYKNFMLCQQCFVWLWFLFLRFLIIPFLWLF